MPIGDFDYLSQLPKLYSLFVIENGATSLDEFFEEQFFDSYSFINDEADEKSEPKEKEKHPVAINLFSINPIAYNISTKLCLKKEITGIDTPVSSFYCNNYKSIAQQSVFHPPHII